MPRRRQAGRPVVRRRRVARPYVRGRGAYTLADAYRVPGALMRRIPRGYYTHGGAALGAGAGSALGPVGATSGATLGRMMGTALADYVHGRGAYKINRNTILMPDPPSVHNRGKEGMVQIRHREYIGDVISSTGFGMQYSLPLNPALLDSFPWLSGIANQFTQWQPNGVLIEFVSTSGNAVASNNTALGEVMIATQYDSVVAPFTTKQQMLNQEFSVSGVPSCNHIHPVECQSRLSGQTNFYTRSAPVPAGADQRLYDLGVVYVATQGQQTAGVTLGELYVTYDILFMKPQLPDVDQASETELQVAQYLATDSTINLASGLNFFGSSGTLQSTFQSSGLGQLAVHQHSIDFPASPSGTGAYCIWVVWFGTGNQTSSMDWPVPSGSVNCTVYTPSSTLPAGYVLPLNGYGSAASHTVTGSVVATCYGVIPTDPTQPYTPNWQENTSGYTILGSTRQCSIYISPWVLEM